MPRWIYTLLLYLLLPLALFKLLWRAIRQPEYLQHIPQRFGFYSTPRPEQPLIWLHAVSVGETRAALPLVEQLRQRYPGHGILLTQTTPTGRATAAQLFGDAAVRAYLPYDLPFAMRRFVRHFRPRVGLIMETELWFNLIAISRQQGLPLLLVNARLSEKSARGYARLGTLARDGLRGLHSIVAQTEDDAMRLRTLGAAQVAVMGNLKFDVTPPASAIELGQKLRARFGTQRPIFLAASTRDGEEALVLDAILAAAIPNLLTVIVPRHPQRFNAVAELLAKRGFSFQRRSQDSLVDIGCEVVLGDSMGEMFAYYEACDVAFIGGSLIPFGGQNLIEACAVGKPVLIGPHTWNFEQVAQAAIAEGAAQRVADVAELAQALQKLVTDRLSRAEVGRSGLEFSARHRGATQRCVALIATVIGPNG